MGIRVGARVKVTRRKRATTTTPAAIKIMGKGPASSPSSSEPAWLGFGLGFG